MNNSADFSVSEVLERPDEIFPNREFKGSAGSAFFFDSEATLVSPEQGQPLSIDTKDSDIRTNFCQNYRYWNKATEFSSSNNFDNSYFKEIVKMGVDAVPYIIEEMEKGPTPLVHALDIIFPGCVEYDGFVTLKDACSTWLSILK